MFTKVANVIQIPRSAPAVAAEAVKKYSHLMAGHDYLTAEQMADAIVQSDSSPEAKVMADELREWTTTVNILNPAAGEIAILKSQKGGVCDVGTERYWSM